MFAPGIPSKERVKQIPIVDKPIEWLYALQTHKAERAGKHHDLRLVTKGDAHSWAIRKLPKPGEKVLAVQQPTHEAPYATWQGRIESGYGKGTVKLTDSGKIEVLEAGPDKVTFIRPSGRATDEFTLARTGGRNWLLVNHSTTKDKYDIDFSKPKYKEQDISAVLEKDSPSKILSAKIDGSHAELLIGPGKRPRLFSYRKPKGKEALEYTYKMPPKFYSRRVGNIANNMLVRGEVWGKDKQGRAISMRELAGVLNSGVEKGRELLRDKGYTLEFAPFAVARVAGKSYEKLPYGEHLRILKRIEGEIGATKLPPMAETLSEKARLLKKIREGRLKETGEGVIIQDKDIAAPPIKAKIRPDFDVYIRGIFTKEKTKAKKEAGGFVYSDTPKGKILGRIGTGFNRNMRKEMYENPDKFRGLAAKVTAHGKFPSGALREPSFADWHYDKSPRSKLRGMLSG